MCDDKHITVVSKALLGVVRLSLIFVKKIIIDKSACEDLFDSQKIFIL